MFNYSGIGDGDDVVPYSAMQWVVMEGFDCYTVDGSMDRFTEMLSSLSSSIVCYAVDGWRDGGIGLLHSACCDGEI